jgi:hypothetical protein
MAVIGGPLSCTDAWSRQTLQLTDLVSTLTEQAARLSTLPLEIEFEARVRGYFPDEHVMAKVPSGKVTVKQSNSIAIVTTSGTETQLELNSTYNTESESGLPYEDQFNSVTIVRWGELLATSEYTTWTIEMDQGSAWPARNYFAYSYDGRDTRLLHGQDAPTARAEWAFSGKVVPARKLRQPANLLPLDDLYRLPRRAQGGIITETSTGTIVDSKYARAEYSRECGYRMVSRRVASSATQESLRSAGMAHVGGLVLPTEFSSLRTKADGTPITTIEVRNVRYRVLSADDVQRALDLEFPAGTVTDESAVDMFIKTYDR